MSEPPPERTDGFEDDPFRSSWIDPEFFKHSPCKYCGSDDVGRVDSGHIRQDLPDLWRCRSCGQQIP